VFPDWVIAGLDEVSSGSVSINGRDVTGLPPADRNVGMVFQNYALFPHMNVRENILYGMRIRRVHAEIQTQNLERVTELMGLSTLLHRYPGQLSGGQQQRVALARVLVAERPLVLMDEPLSNLDAKLRVEIRSEIRELNRKLGITVVYVTHDQSEALSMSDKVLLMQQGKMSQLGTPAEIYSKPENIFAASFIGTPPMNLIPAALLGSDFLGTHSVTADDLQIGIRPEAVVLHHQPSTTLGTTNLKGTIVNAEFEGAQTLVVVNVGGQADVVTLVSNAASIEMGAQVYLEIDLATLCFFNSSDGKRVLIEPDWKRSFAS